MSSNYQLRNDRNEDLSNIEDVDEERDEFHLSDIDDINIDDDKFKMVKNVGRH
jgi:hypothetical protein